MSQCDRGVILLIGAGGLLGRSLSNVLAASGHPLILADSDQGALAGAVSALPQQYPLVDSIVVSSTKKTPAVLLFEAVKPHGSELTGVINAAYPGKQNLNLGRAPVRDERVVSEFVGEHVSFFLETTNLFSRQLADNGGGFVTNLSSIYGSTLPSLSIYEGTELFMPPEYAAAKAGVEMLTRYFAMVHKTAGVRINSIGLGGIRDPSHPEVFVNRYQEATSSGLLDPDEAALAIKHLSVDGVNAVTGQNHIIDGGFSLR